MLRDPALGRSARRDLLALDLLALLAALLVLGPALGAGFVLSYDLVWVPDLAVTAQTLGWSTGVPRAVPSDLVVAVADNLIGGALLEKVVLLCALVAAGAGYHRVAALVLAEVASPRVVRIAQVGACVLAVWNPFVAERLAIGHWPLLLAHAALGWIVVLSRARPERAGWLPLQPVLQPALLLVIWLGSLSASAGILTACATLVFCGFCAPWAQRADPRTFLRRLLVLVVVLLAANAPWLVAGTISAGRTLSDPALAEAAAQAFAPQGASGVPTPIAVLGLGGIWNDQTTAPMGSINAWGWAALVVVSVVVLLLATLRPSDQEQRSEARSRASRGRRLRIAALVVALLGWGWAMQAWLAPGVGAWLAVHLPGGAVMRDAARAELLMVPAVVMGQALIVAGLARVIRGRALLRAVPGTRFLAGFAVAMVPLLLLPGLAWGSSGAIRAVAYPQSYLDLAATMAEERGVVGEPVVLSLPLSSYRAPQWNERRPVLDPVPRLLGSVEAVASDELVVGGEVVGRDDPLVARVANALVEPDAERRSTALGALGITHVVQVHGPDVDGLDERFAPEVAGEVIAGDDDLEVVRLSADAAGSPLAAPALPARIALVVAWSAWALVLCVGVAGAIAARARALRAVRHDGR